MGTLAAAPQFDLLTSPVEGITLIEASAGTGKTHALSSLFLKLLVQERCLVREILVVTYTEAATAELSDRIRQLLRSALRFVVQGDPSGLEDPARTEILLRGRGDPGLADRLRDAVRTFDEAEISTIHGFCRSVLAENAFESGSAFHAEPLADESELVAEVSDDFWRLSVAGAPVSWHRLRMASGSFRRGPAGLAPLLRRRPPSPNLRIRPEGPAPDVAALEAALLRAFGELTERWKEGEAEVRALLLEHGAWHGGRFRTARRERIFAALSSLSSRPDPWDPALLDQAAALAPEALAALVKEGQSPPEHPVFRACGTLASRLAELRSALALFEHVLEREYLEYARDELERRKRRLSRWSFDDLLVQTHRALEGPMGEALLRRLRERFRAALIDEFQDTDPLQEAIFLRVFGTGSRSTLYLIGDPKQAIYGFRGADVHAYLEAAAKAGSRLSLGANWRSSQVLVAAVNEIFGSHGLPFVHPGIGFQPSTAVVRAEGAAPAHPGSPELAIQLAPTGTRLTKADALHLFSRAAACTVSRLVAAGWRPRDIAVLVRSNRQARVAQAALADVGVPGVLYSADSVFVSDEAAELERVLGALAHPGSEASLRSALATRILGRSAAEIDGLAAPELDRLLERSVELGRIWREHGLMRAARALLDEEGVRERLLRLPRGERRLTNLLHLLELLHRAEGSERLGVEELLAWLAERVDSGGEGEESELRLETDEDAVTISTIHHAKGLEYDVVLCPFLWDGARVDGLSAVLYHDADGSPVLDLEGGEEARGAALAEQLAELVRLAYVALTRAKRVCSVSWGWIDGSALSPLFYLLHCRDFRPGLVPPSRLGTELAARFDAMNGAALEAAVEAIARDSGGALSVRALEETPAPLRPRRAAASAGEARQYDRAGWNAWTVTSYTGLTRGGRHQPRPERDADALETAAGAGDDAAALEGIAAFPRGASAGSFIHSLMEAEDFAASDPAAKVAALAERCREWGYPERWAPVLAEMVRNAAQVPLEPPPKAFRLADVPARDRLAELEFHLPVERLTASALAEVVAREGGELRGMADAVARLDVGTVSGFLQGFIDLVVRSSGRFYLLDWKSNYLGPSPASYAPPALAESMRRNLYDLQLTLYAVALHRYLGRRMPSYEYDLHFGGARYVYLRGLTQGSAASGVHVARPRLGLVAGISELLGGEP